MLTGISSRRICSTEEDSFTLAVGAALKCLSHSKIRPKDIDAIISCSITRYMDGYNQVYEPSFSSLIKEKIGASQAINFDVSNACAGMLTRIYLADALIKQGSIRNCLIVSGEFITSLTENAIRNIKNLASHELASLTVGDAGAAVMLESTTDSGSAISLAGFRSDTRYNHLCTARPGRSRPGASMKTKAKKIHEVSIRKSLLIIKDALSLFGIAYSDIDFLIPHQTSRSAILSGARMYSRTFGGHPGKIVVNLVNNGNTASTTHFLTLYQMLFKKRFKPGDQIMLLSFASGIVMGILLFRPKDLLLRYVNCEIEMVSIAQATSGIRSRSAIRLSAEAVESCLTEVQTASQEIQQLVSSGLYRDKHIGEPSIASLIHGSLPRNLPVADLSERPDNNDFFCFDVSNGGCGFLQGIQLTDACIQQGRISQGMVVAGDAPASTREDRMFPFARAASAILLHKTEKPCGFMKFYSNTYPAYQSDFSSQLQWTLPPGKKKKVNVFSVRIADDFADHYLVAAELSLAEFFFLTGTRKDMFDLYITSLSPEGFPGRLGVITGQINRFVLPETNWGPVHTAGLGFGLRKTWVNGDFNKAKNILFLAVGSGLTISIAWYQKESGI